MRAARALSTTASTERPSRRGAAVAVAATLVALVVLTAARPARAHLLPADTGTLNVLGDSVFAAVSIPVSALHGFDDDGDGLLEMRELRAHEAALRAEVGRRLVIADGDSPGTPVSVDLVLSPQHSGPQDRSAQVVVLDHVRLSGAHTPRDLRARCDLLGAGADARLTFTATLHPEGGPAEKETATLTPEAPEHRFFRPRVASLATSLPCLVVVFGLAGLGMGWRRRGARSPAGARTSGVDAPAGTPTERADSLAGGPTERGDASRTPGG